MPKRFEVHYSFTCPNTACLKRNEDRVEVMATDVVNARDEVFATVRCADCGFNLPAGHHFATTVKEVKL